MIRRDDGTEDWDTRCLMSQGCDCPACDAAEFDDSDDDGAPCSWCGGDGWEDCDDPIQCCAVHNVLGECPCGPCNGTGLAKHQWLW